MSTACVAEARNEIEQQEHAHEALRYFLGLLDEGRQPEPNRVAWLCRIVTEEIIDLRLVELLDARGVDGLIEFIRLARARPATAKELLK
jgi:hypothetical protein